jgi:carboxypeptidase Q
MQQVAQLAAPLNATLLLPNGAETDTGPWAQIGVPAASLATHNEKYFFFHHSEGDTMSVFTPGTLDRAAALYAIAAFTVANMPDLLPR